MPHVLPPSARFALFAMVLLVLASCGEPPVESKRPASENPTMRAEAPTPAWPQGDLFPLAEGMRWTWRARSGQNTWLVVARKFGGDVRHEEGRRVRYGFVYASMNDDSHEIMKSIYTQPSGGPREFNLDYLSVRIGHTPAVRLLPREPALDARWQWQGVLTVNHHAREVTTTLQVAGRERIETPAGTYDAIRIDETTEGLRISRWFVPDVGLARLEAVGTHADQELDFALELTAFEGPH